MVSDIRCRQHVKNDPNMSVPWFLMASYLYYHKDVSLISDATYDGLAQVLTAFWPRIEHRHKYLIQPDMLRTGSAFNLKVEDYPGMCRSAAEMLAVEHGLLGIEDTECPPLTEVLLALRLREKSQTCSMKEPKP